MSHLSPEKKAFLKKTAESIVAPGKGILAADESNASVGKRFEGIKIANSFENRRAFREMLFTAPNSELYLGGVILFEETFEQSDVNGVRLVDILRKKGINVGIKLDKGLVPIPGTCDEKFTQGLYGLGDRCKKFSQLGAVFAKWRCVLKISEKDHTPSDLSYKNVADTLAMYALICQENGIVPIVEPEVLRDGDHDIEVARKVTERILSLMYNALMEHGVYLEGTLLKPNMVTPGEGYKNKLSPQDIANATISALSRTVPPCVPGITFLSGGQSEKEASIHLDAINKHKGSCPWALTFSFARALQHSAISAWCGKKDHLSSAHKILTQRMLHNSHASLGKYIPNEDIGADESSYHVAGHSY